MPNYFNSKIYQIRSYQTDLCYVGATTQSLAKRFYEHKTIQRNCSSKLILDYGDAYIELICNYPCFSKNELHKEEGRWIRKLNCVNKIIAGRTHKEYFADNKDKINKMKKIWHSNNKEKNNKKSREYHHINKNNIAKRKKEKVKCKCGAIVSRGYLSNHRKTKKHLDNI